MADLALAQDQWIYPALESGWKNVGRSHMPARFRRLANGLVVVNGEIKNGECDSVVLEFPEGYRPVALMSIPVVGADHATIYQGGELAVFGKCQGQISINFIFQSGGRY